VMWVNPSLRRRTWAVPSLDSAAIDGRGTTFSGFANAEGNESATVACCSSTGVAARRPARAAARHWCERSSAAAAHHFAPAASQAIIDAATNSPA
jgi:hypothetical protein